MAADLDAELREQIRKLCSRYSAEYWQKLDRARSYPEEFVQELTEAGYLDCLIPEQYGGSFIDVVSYGIICEELARVDWVVASVVSVINSLAGGSILRFGSEEQKERWLPGMARGEILCSACLTEPGGGTDLGNLKTTATRVDGGWKLNGTKVFISHAAHAGLFFTVASIDLEKKHKGVTAFLVDPKTDGISLGEFPMRTLKRDNLAEVHFEDSFVPDDCVLGEPGGGFPILGSALDMGRYSVAARCVGQSQRTLDLAVTYANQREAFGQRIGEFQMIQQKIADMVCRTEGARAVVYRLGRMKDAGIQRASMEASIAKLMASEANTQNALDAVQIHGGYGVVAEYEVGRHILEAKALEFGEGTSELHRKLIAEYALGIRKQ